MVARPIGGYLLDGSRNREIPIRILGVGHARRNSGISLNVSVFLSVTLGVDEQSVLFDVVINPHRGDVWHPVRKHRNDVGERFFLEKVMKCVWNCVHITG